MQNIEIKPKLNGWVVTVGCQDVLFTSKDKMLSEIGRYIDNPKEVQEEYLENAKNETQQNGTPIEMSIRSGGSDWGITANRNR